MSLPDFSTLVARHRAYFQTGAGTVMNGLKPPLVPPGFLKITVCAPDTTTTAGFPGGDSVGHVARS
jgi:hypothetical protein